MQAPGMCQHPFALFGLSVVLALQTHGSLFIVAANQACLCCVSVILSPELDHWVDDPTDPRMLAADRRLAALTASLGSDSNAAMAAAMV